MASLLAKQAKTDAKTQATRHQQQQQQKSTSNPYLRYPLKHPSQAIFTFLKQARSTALKQTIPSVEIEARIGILKAPFGMHERRIASSAEGGGRAFEVTSIEPRALYESGVTRSHYVHWTQAGLSEQSPITLSLHAKDLKRDLEEVETVETVYAGYPNDRRVCFMNGRGKMEHKEKLLGMDVALPSAPYDLRLTLATEKSLDNHVTTPPSGWTSKRIKRRRSYTRRDKSIAWQLDITEVTTTYPDATKTPEVTYEIEMELNQPTTLKLLKETDDTNLRKLGETLSQQLWYMLYQINPLHDALDVEQYLRDHPDHTASRLALATCGAIKKFMDGNAQGTYRCPIGGPDEGNLAALANVNFVGCMPVNFSRHNIEEVQRSPENGYFLSEKTDGVRYFMIFTGSTVVLVDRAMKGKQIVPRNSHDDDSNSDPMNHVMDLIKPGTVLDGEVVVHRKLRRPIFIVFDVLALSSTEPILHLPFAQRLQHLRRASFRTPTARRDMFAPANVTDPKIALPLVRKNFVDRTELDTLLSHVSEERSLRIYKNGDTHNHLTDGIIFQPNTPYACGTDRKLLKWKYLDTVTIDVKILPPQGRDADDDILRVACMGDEGSLVDMTRHIHLPNSERRRLEADRHGNGSKIAEVGFDPTVGEWYYLTMRPDKIAPNHISTVLGTLLELAESLTTEELRYRMSVPAGARDTFGKEVRTMQKQLLDHQRKQLKRQREAHGNRPR